MIAYVVLVDGHVYAVLTSPVDAHLIAKPLNATVEQCRLNAVVQKAERPPCEHVSRKVANEANNGPAKEAAATEAKGGVGEGEDG